MKFGWAIGASVAAHGVLAVALLAYMKCVPSPTVVATLDLSSVELSFAEEESAVAPAVSAPVDQPPPPPEPVLAPPPDVAPPEPAFPSPPDPTAPSMPEPEPDRPRMETPQPREETPPPPAERPAPPTAAPRQARVDAPPSPRRAIRPEYPRGARQRGEQGDVVLEIGVSAEGTVDRVSVVSSCGYAELDEAAVRAARAARFTPAKSGRDPVASTARLTLTFRLK